jgi:hypothetical protein
MALLKFESPKVIELRGFGVPPRRSPMVSNEINQSPGVFLKLFCPISILCPKFLLFKIFS